MPRSVLGLSSSTERVAREREVIGVLRFVCGFYEVTFTSLWSSRNHHLDSAYRRVK